MVPGRYTAFSNNKKMVTILHRELERKVEKVKHMRLEVMRPKTKNFCNYVPFRVFSIPCGILLFIEPRKK